MRCFLIAKQRNANAERVERGREKETDAEICRGDVGSKAKQKKERQKERKRERGGKRDRKREKTKKKIRFALILANKRVEI